MSQIATISKRSLEEEDECRHLFKGKLTRDTSLINKRKMSDPILKVFCFSCH